MKAEIWLPPEEVLAALQEYLDARFKTEKAPVVTTFRFTESGEKSFIVVVTE